MPPAAINYLLMKAINHLLMKIEGIGGANKRHGAVRWSQKIGQFAKVYSTG